MHHPTKLQPLQVSEGVVRHTHEVIVELLEPREFITDLIEIKTGERYAKIRVNIDDLSGDHTP